MQQARNQTQGRISPLCKYLRSKKTAFSPIPPRSEEELFDGSCACWCGKTLKAVGPDAEVCDPEDCRSDRDCYEAVV